MIASGSIAFANARVRALKSRLLGREIAGRMSAGLAITRDRSTDPADGFRELLEWYAVALKSYPYGQPLLIALLRRFEIENVKLVWRAVVNRLDQARWIRPPRSCTRDGERRASATAFGRRNEDLSRSL